MLEVEKSETPAGRNCGSGADGDQHTIIGCNIDQGYEPPLRKPVIAYVRVAGPVAAHGIEEVIRGGVERAKVPIFIEDFDATVDDHYNLRWTDCTHAVGRDETRLRKLGAQETASHDLRRERLLGC